MNLLIVTPYIPYPLNHGGSVAQFGIIDYIRDYINITLVLVVTNEGQKKDVQNLKDKWLNVQFEIINQQPENSFRDNFFNVIRNYKNKGKSNGNDFKLDIRDNSTLYWPKSEEFIQMFADIINRTKPELIQIDFLTYIDLVVVIPRTIKTVFVHHELRFAKIESALAIQNEISKTDNYYYKETRTRELAFLELYNYVIVFSEIDKKKISTLNADIKILISPFSIPLNNLHPSIKIQKTIQKLIFIGGESHFPNIDALEWYINEMADEVGKLNGLTLHIVGNWTPKTIKKHTQKYIHFEGYVNDISEFGKDSIMIVPIRIGSGIRTKILDAMACGIPIITTSIGCEGIKGIGNKDYIIADTTNEFVHEIDRLHKSFKLRNDLVSHAMQTVNTYYSPENAGDLRIKSYEQVLN